MFGPDGEIHAQLPTPDFGGDGTLSSDFVIAPMDGSIKEILVDAGESVEEGQEVMTLFAMKVESKLRAPRSGVIAAVNASVGDQVSLNSIVISLEPEEEETKD